MPPWSVRRWDLWAPVYDFFVGRLRRARRRSIEAARIREEERVLLPGAGTGLDLEFLPRASTTVCVEPAPGMIARLQRRRGGAHVVMGDAMALPVADRSIDCVLLHLIVAVVPEPVLVLREAARVVADGGRIVVMDKFAHGRPGLLRRLINPLAQAIATDITLDLDALAVEAGLEITHREAAAFGGLFQVAILQSSSELDAV